VPISGKPEIGAPPQDEVCGFKLYPPDPVGFMESIYRNAVRIGRTRKDDAEV
jgi:hypothetical protein